MEAKRINQGLIDNLLSSHTVLKPSFKKGNIKRKIKKNSKGAPIKTLINNNTKRHNSSY